MFQKVSALAIYVTDLERAKVFYTDVLGFEISAQVSSNLCFLKSKSGKIHIYLDAGKKPAAIDNQTIRLSFFLEAEKSAPEAYEALKTAGVTLLQESPELVGENIACFQFQDPDGNIIEVSGKAEA
jgi:catechol 2,3-dioxygenase-like lactoylglutathione lyase family enzyme